MSYTVGDKKYLFKFSNERGACEKCAFHKKPHSCKASDLFDSGVLPQCDSDGIGDGYYVLMTGDNIKLEDKPGICPNCGSENVNFGGTAYEYDDCWQDCGCQDCGTEWFEIYKFDRKAYKIYRFGEKETNR